MGFRVRRMERSLAQPQVMVKPDSPYHLRGKDAQAAKLNLTPTNAWKALLAFGGEDLKKHAFERDRSFVGQGTAVRSRLWSLLTTGTGHQQVALDPESLDRFATWMDTYAQRVGHFSEAQEKELVKFRASLSAMQEQTSREK